MCSQGIVVKVAIFKINQLGDNIVFLSVVQALRRFRSDWELFVLTTPIAAAIYGPETCSERHLIMERGRFNSAWKSPQTLFWLLGQIRHFRPNRCLFATDQGNVAHLLGKMSGAKIRVGSRRPFHKVPGAITHEAPFDPSANVALDGWRLLQKLTADTEGPSLPDIPPPPNLSHLLEGGHRIAGRVAIHPGASHEYQRWPMDRYLALAKHLESDFEVLWISHGSESVAGLSRKVKLVRSQSLEELVRLIASANLFVGNNSGPHHLATALATPSVIINGPTARNWDPFWHSDRILMLRDETLPCLPCDSVFPANAGECRNVKRMACMEKWTVDVIEEHVRMWLHRWAIAGK